jgi:HAD superfamily hydrolase (TIGR01509 family)
MFARPVEAVLFDMDGLLIDTEAVYVEAYMAAGRTMAVDIPLALCHATSCIPGHERQAMIQAHFGSGFEADSFQACFREHASRLLAARIPVKPGAADLLAWLSERGLPLAVATSARRPTVQRHLGRAGLLDHFTAVVTRDDVARSKPHPDVYLEAARRLGVPPEHCIALEDSNTGLTAAHAAGTMAIMVPDILPPTDEVRAKCVHVASDLMAVLGLLRAALGPPLQG